MQFKSYDCVYRLLKVLTLEASDTYRLKSMLHKCLLSRLRLFHIQDILLRVKTVEKKKDLQRDFDGVGSDIGISP